MGGGPLAATGRAADLGGEGERRRRGGQLRLKGGEVTAGQNNTLSAHWHECAGTSARALATVASALARALANRDARASARARAGSRARAVYKDSDLEHGYYLVHGSVEAAGGEAWGGPLL